MASSSSEHASVMRDGLTALRTRDRSRRSAFSAPGAAEPTSSLSAQLRRGRPRAFGLRRPGMDSRRPFDTRLTSRSGLLYVPIPEEQHRRGEAVHEVASADRPELACGEETSHGDIAERAPQRADVVIGLAEETQPATVAREMQRGGYR